MNNWEYKLYRVEWAVIVAEVDQYHRITSVPPIYEKAFPTKELAQDDLNRITHEHKYVPNRRVCNFAPHEYHDCYIHKRETLVGATLIHTVVK